MAKTQLPLLGSHLSIAGGFHKAVLAAAEIGCDCVQIFTAAPQQWPKRRGEASQVVQVSTKNNNQRKAKEITENDVELFQNALRAFGIQHPLSHSSYLINLGTPDEELWRKSVDAFVVELQRAETLGIPYVVLHPGAYTTSTEAKGVRRIIRGLNEVHKQTRDIASQCLLETTAGQGSSIGHTFEQLARIIDGVRDPERLGICFDTCHVFAAGYSMETEAEYKSTMKELNKTVDVKAVKAFHLNDSKKPLGSRVDRHEHIGMGEMGLEPFRHLLNDRRFRKTPMYLETPKGENDQGQNWDEVNLQTLRALIE